ncbi:MAG: hypothetical protein WD176_05145, partial [Pirellulales bacterium]
MRPRMALVGASAGAVLLVHFVYALAVVPLVEPAATAREATRAIDLSHLRMTSNPYHRLLAQFFPADSWSLKNPKILESEHGLLLIDKYQTIGGTSIELSPLAMVLFPSQAVRNDPERAGEALVLEAPRAVLEFDKTIDLARARIGNLKGGRLIGAVTIRSNQKLPTPEDDLLITTRDVQLTEERIRTPEPVEFRLGPNHGSGRELVIRLRSRRDSRTEGAAGPNVAGLRMLELLRDVQMHFQMSGPGLLPGSKNQHTVAKPAPSAGRLAAPSNSPVQITSRGPFRFDFTTYEASFEEQVDVLRLNPDAPSDQMTCEQLTVGFAPREQASTAAAATGRKEKIPALEVRRLRAQGNPVIVRSPSTGASARCQTLVYDLKTGKLTLDDPQRVMLREPTRQVQAPSISYQPGGPGELGLVDATGPGCLETKSEAEGSPAFRAEWGDRLRVRPHQGQSLLSVSGGGRIAMIGMGALSADEMWVWFRKSETREKSAPSVAPDRMLATGRVRIDSPRFSGSPERLEIWFQHAAAAPAAADGGAATFGKDPTDPPEAISLPMRRGNDTSPVAEKMELAGKLVRLNVQMRGAQATVEDISLTGGVRLSQKAVDGATEAPLEIRADEVQVRRASSPGRKIAVIGRPAFVSARGLSMTGARIDVDQESNLAWIDGPGRMTLPANRGLPGRTKQAAQ